ncbi:MAG: ABC transporter substrate-binding protein [Acidobacteria bacterium]|nr:ABC transporter substrate-binding protein [Acidobacteriota bacterium]
MRRLATLAVLVAQAAFCAAPQRIVSTAPSVTEILYALGLGSRVVGVTQYCRYPADAQTKPKIGTFLEPDFERILSLRPDLVIVISNPIQVAERLRKLGLNAQEVKQDSIADTMASIRAIGGWTGTGPQALNLEQSIRASLDQVRAHSQKLPRKQVLFLVGRAPGTLQGMVGTGPATFVDELITLAGGVNMLRQSPIAYPRVSLEQILSANPDIILDMGDFAHGESKPLEPAARVLALWAKYPQLKAVGTGGVIQVASEIFIRPGPRLGQAAIELERMIHGSKAK